MKLGYSKICTCETEIELVRHNLFTAEDILVSLFYEPLAQLVEHLTFNQGVDGSSPSWLTRSF